MFRKAWSVAILFSLVALVCAQEGEGGGYQYDPEPIVDSVPEQCVEACSSISSTFDTCMELDCLCTTGNNGALLRCINCLYGAEPGQTALLVGQETLRDFSLICDGYDGIVMQNVTTSTTTSSSTPPSTSPPPPSSTPSTTTTPEETTPPPSTTETPPPSTSDEPSPTTETTAEPTTESPPPTPTTASTRPSTTPDWANTSGLPTPSVFQTPPKCQLVRTSETGSSQAVLAKRHLVSRRSAGSAQSKTSWTRFRKAFLSLLGGVVGDRR